jgi:hypothetical protein
MYSHFLADWTKSEIRSSRPEMGWIARFDGSDDNGIYLL